MLRTILLMFLCFSILAPSQLRADAKYPQQVSNEDEVRIRKVVDQYVQSWLKNDAEGVLSVFHNNAVLLPHHGLEPVEGKDAIRAFWWPEASPPVTINEFTVALEEIGGDAGIAYARGHFQLKWTSQGKTVENRGTHLMILRKNDDGGWLITHHMWGDPQN